MARDIGMTDLHNPRTHQHGNINANGFVIEEARSTTAGSRRSCGRRFGRFTNQQNHVLIVDIQTAFIGQLAYFRKRRPASRGNIGEKIERQYRGLTQLKIPNSSLAFRFVALFSSPVGMSISLD